MERAGGMRAVLAAAVLALAGPAAAEAAGIVQVAAGAVHSCALDDSGQVWCWGANWHGQLGDGTTETRPSPVPVPGLGGVRQLAAGKAHSCALDEAG